MQNNDNADQSNQAQEIKEKLAVGNTDDQKTSTDNGSKKGSFSKFIKKHPVLFTALVGILAVVIVYFWKDIEGNRRSAKIEKRANEQLQQNSEDMMKLVTKPLIWSIRSEMLRGNLEQVNLFTNELVKEKNFQFIHLIDPGGSIIVSTDKKLEGQSAIGMFDANLIQADSVIVINNNTEMMTVAAPVMGFDKKLAILIMNYTVSKFDSKTDMEPDNKTDIKK